MTIRKSISHSLVLVALAAISGRALAQATNPSLDPVSEAEKQALEEKSGPVVAADGDRAGNGGHIVELRTVNLAYKALDAMRALRQMSKMPSSPAIDKLDLDRLEKKLKYAIVRTATGVELEGFRKTHANFPDSNLVLIDTEEFRKFQASEPELFQLVVHEVMPLGGVKDRTYNDSRAIAKAVVDNKLLVEAPSEQRPELLFSEAVDGRKTGLDWSKAAELCQMQKDIHARDFYFVYCVYIEKTRIDKVPVVIDDHTVVTEYNPRTGRHTVTSHSHHVDTKRIHKTSVYGLRVFGVGREAELRWKTLFTSLSFYDGKYSLTFETDREANRACRAVLRARGDDDAFRYYRAKCRTPQVEGTTRHYYEIITQNPYVTGIDQK